MAWLWLLPSRVPLICWFLYCFEKTYVSFSLSPFVTIIWKNSFFLVIDGLLLVPVVEWCLRLLGMERNFIIVALGIISGVAVYLLAASVMKLREFDDMKEILLRKIKRNSA